MIAAQPFLGGGQRGLVYDALDTLIKVIGNVVRCGNSDPKFRRLRMDNPRIATSVLNVPGEAAGNGAGLWWAAVWGPCQKCRHRSAEMATARNLLHPMFPWPESNAAHGLHGKVMQGLRWDVTHRPTQARVSAAHADGVQRICNVCCLSAFFPPRGLIPHVKWHSSLIWGLPIPLDPSLAPTLKDCLDCDREPHNGYVPGASEVLLAGGFRLDLETRAFVHPDDPASCLNPTRALLSRLERLRDKKGHTGDATFNDDLPRQGHQAPPASPFYGRPGFRYGKPSLFHGLGGKPRPNPCCEATQ